MVLLRKNTATHPLQMRNKSRRVQSRLRRKDTGDEDGDEDEDEDSDQGDEEASCGAPGEQKGVGDGKSAADVLIVGEEKAQYHKEDGKRAIEGVNDALVLSLCCSTGVRVRA